MDTLANFNGFRVLASSLNRRRSTEVTRTLQDIWPSPALVHYIYILGGACPLTEFCQVQNSLCVQVLCSPSLLAVVLHRTPEVGVSQTLRRGTRNGITELSQTAPPICGHHVGHRPTFLVLLCTAHGLYYFLILRVLHNLDFILLYLQRKWPVGPYAFNKIMYVNVCIYSMYCNNMQ